MKRDLNKYIAEYEKMFNSGKAGQIYSADIQTIYNRNIKNPGGHITNAELYHCVSDALIAGFMIGLKYEQERRKNSTRNATQGTPAR